MSIQCIQSVGQNGNQLFPTVLACVAALKHGLCAPHYENRLVTFKEPSLRLDASRPSMTHKTSTPLEGDLQHKDVEMRRGYYQNEALFNPYRDVIKNKVLQLPQLEKNTDDIVIHLRLDGFNHSGYNSHIIDPEWYVSILRRETFGKLYIVMATKSGRIKKGQDPYKRRYIERFKEFNHEIVSNDEKTDFEFIRKFDKIVCSNSTFGWWAAFLSEASVVYLPPYWEGRASKLSKIGTVGRVIQDNYGYINIVTMLRVPTTFQ